MMPARLKQQQIGKQKRPLLPVVPVVQPVPVMMMLLLLLQLAVVVALLPATTSVPTRSSSTARLSWPCGSLTLRYYLSLSLSLSPSSPSFLFALN